MYAAGRIRVARVHQTFRTFHRVHVCLTSGLLPTFLLTITFAQVFNPIRGYTTPRYSLIAASSQQPKVNNPLSANVFVDADIIRHLKMKNHARKTRLLISKTDLERYSLGQLRKAIGNLHEDLKYQPYKLRYKIIHSNNTAVDQPLLLDTEHELESLINKFMEHNFKIQLFVQSNPSIFPPPDATKNILSGMTEDPLETDTYTMVSFYKFSTISDVDKTIAQLYSIWEPFKCYGRVYVASEGVNAQMAIPTNILPYFQKATESLSIFKNIRLNTDHRVTKQEYFETLPFKNLHIRKKDQIVTDGFLDPIIPSSTTTTSTGTDNIDMCSIQTVKLTKTPSAAPAQLLDFTAGTGREIEPLEWHEALDNPNNIVLDCRNNYESDIGKFDNAIPLSTSLFKESWSALDELLKDKPKDTPIMTYCTGGIRCVKINAYLQQKLGFSNTGRLKGGIISYTRQLELLAAAGKTETLAGDGGDNSDCVTANEDDMASNNDGATDRVDDTLSTDIRSRADLLTASKDDRNLITSKFKGVNYVFDDRLGARVTDDILAVCETCGASCDSYTNCLNPTCNVRFIQCGGCKTFYGGCCSQSCQHEYAAYLTQKQATKTPNHTFARATSKTTAALASIARSRGPTASKTSTNTSKECENIQYNGNGNGADSHLQPSSIRNIKKTAQTSEMKSHANAIDATFEALGAYADRYTADEPLLLQQLRDETEAVMGPQTVRMMSGHMQGRLLAMLTSISGAENVLELGTFTGYSTLCFAEGLSDKSKESHTHTHSDSDSHGQVVSCESDYISYNFAKKWVEKSKYAHKVDLRHTKAEELLTDMRESGLKFDMVFIDADKKKYTHYLKTILGDNSSDFSDHSQQQTSLLNDGALIIVDNTLWKGLVLGEVPELAAHVPDAAQYGESKRMKLLASCMHEFNTFVRGHKQLSPVLIPMRDGLSIIRYSSAGEREE